MKLRSLEKSLKTLSKEVKQAIEAEEKGVITLPTVWCVANFEEAREWLKDKNPTEIQAWGDGGGGKTFPYISLNALYLTGAEFDQHHYTKITPETFIKKVFIPWLREQKDDRYITYMERYEYYKWGEGHSTTDYSILSEDGKSQFKAEIWWRDTSGEPHAVKTTDIGYAETLLGLLSGNITLEDLKP